MFEEIKTTKAPQAIGPYSQAVKLGDFVYLSGQLPVDPLTGEIVAGNIMEQTYQVFANIEAVLEAMNLELRHILKMTVFMSDLSDFEEMNQIYATLMSDPYPARSTIQVARLPKDAKIEIECVVIDTLEYEKAMKEHHHHHDHDQQHHHHHDHGHDCDCGHDHNCDCHDHEHPEQECEGNCCG